MVIRILVMSPNTERIIPQVAHLLFECFLCMSAKTNPIIPKIIPKNGPYTKKRIIPIPERVLKIPKITEATPKLLIWSGSFFMLVTILSIL